MIHSMTGYAVQSKDLGRLTLNLELRSVNSRYLDLGFRVAEDLRQGEPLLRDLLSSRLTRGKVDCRLGFTPNDSAPRDMALNGELLRQLQGLQRAVLQELPHAAPLSVAELLRWPGMLADDRISFEEMQPAIIALGNQAIDELIATRRREGEKLAATIVERVGRMRELVAQVEPKMPQILADYYDKITTRLREAVATLDEDRIRQEVGVYAQRIDVAEELSRLRTHLDEVTRVVSKGGAAGKRLDFLMQELNREANTLASKSTSAELTGIAVELKLLVEQMREQVQNIE